MEQNQNNGVPAETKQPETKQVVTNKEEGRGGWRKMFWAGLIIVIVLGLAANQRQNRQEGNQSAQVSSGFWSNLFGNKEEAKGEKLEVKYGSDTSFAKNADYVSPLDRTALYSVRDGEYKSDTVEFIPNQDMIAKGDLNNDGKEDAAIVVNQKTANHDFSMISVLENTGNGYQNIRTFLLGDNIKVTSLKIENGIVRAGIVSHHASDLISEPTSMQVVAIGYDAESGWSMNYAQ